MTLLHCMGPGFECRCEEMGINFLLSTNCVPAMLCKISFNS